MVKHTQTIRRLFPTNFLSLFDHFEGLALKELNTRRDINKEAITSNVIIALVLREKQSKYSLAIFIHLMYL